MSKHTTIFKLMATLAGVTMFCSLATSSDSSDRHKDRSDVATLVVIRPSLPIVPDFYIDNVDHSANHKSFRMKKSIELPPGRHEIELGHTQSIVGVGYMPSVSCGISFEAEAGKTYAVVTRFYDHTLSAFLTTIDQSSKKSKKPEFNPEKDIECLFI